MPSVSGAGAVLISLIFIALILTSEETRKIALNWEFAVALVAISVPLSILITQVYHAVFTKFGYRRKNWSTKYSGRGMDMHRIDVMMDYLCWKKDKGEKEWAIIQKRATAYHLFDMLWLVSVFFLVSYTYILALVWNGLYGYSSICWLGVGLVYGMVIPCCILFWLASRDLWGVFMLLDRKIAKSIETELDSWIEDEGDLTMKTTDDERKTNLKHTVVAVFSALACMVLNDFSLHLFELLRVEQYHPFYSFFWSSQMSVRATYTNFWTVYWGLAFVLTLLLGVLLWKGFRRRQTQ